MRRATALLIAFFLLAGMISIPSRGVRADTFDEYPNLTGSQVADDDEFGLMKKNPRGFKNVPASELPNLPQLTNKFAVKTQVNSETLSGTRTILGTDLPVQWLNPNGANRTVLLPLEADSTRLWYWVRNTSASSNYTLTIKNSTGATTLGVLMPGESGLCRCEGTIWRVSKTFAGTGPINADALSNRTGIGALPQAGNKLYVEDAHYPGAGGGTEIGLRSYLYSVPQAQPTSNLAITSMYAGSNYNSTYDAPGQVEGLQAYASNYGSGTLPQVTGVRGVAQNRGNAVPSQGVSLYGLRGWSENSGTGSVTHAIGIKLERTVNNGTIANAYGVYVADQTPSGAGSVTNGTSGLHFEGAGIGNAVTWSGSGGSIPNAWMYSPSAGNVNLKAGASGRFTIEAGQMNIATAKTPASSSDACAMGDIAWDSGYVYVCTGTNAWKRSALTAW